MVATGWLVSSCSDQLDVTMTEAIYGEYIKFNSSVNSYSGKTRTQTRSMGNNISSEEDEWLYCDKQNGVTRGTPVTSINDSVGLIGYKLPEGTSMDDTKISWNKMTNQKYILEGDELRAATTPIPWSTIDPTESLKVYAYSPYNASSVTEITGIPTLNFTVGNEITKQADLIIADTIVKPADHKKNISLTFKHILTAIRFKAHFKCTVLSITVKNIKNSGNNQGCRNKRNVHYSK